MRTFFQKRIPISKQYSYGIADAVISPLLVFICLISFKPYILSEISFKNQLIISSIISSNVFIVLLLKSILVSKMQQTGKWNFKMSLITLFSILFIISILIVAPSHFILTAWLKIPSKIDTQFVLVVFGLVHLIGILLYFVSISMRYIFYKPPNTDSASSGVPPSIELNKENNSPLNIIITGKNQGEKLDIQVEQLLCISTNGHYIDIFYLLSGSKKVQKVVFRNSIQAISDSSGDQKGLFQCHRSHLINIDHILGITGNSKKTDIKMAHLNQKIPVSRSKTDELSKIVKNRP